MRTLNEINEKFPEVRTLRELNQIRSNPLWQVGFGFGMVREGELCHCDEVGRLKPAMASVMFPNLAALRPISPETVEHMGHDVTVLMVGWYDAGRDLRGDASVAEVILGVLASSTSEGLVDVPMEAAG